MNYPIWLYILGRVGGSADQNSNTPPEEARGPVEDRSENPHRTSDPREHYAELDALRGIAVFGVLMNHAAGYWFINTRSRVEAPLLEIDLMALFQFGYLGVSVFFLLSGYLLVWTEGKRVERGSYSLLNYAKRRALRLIPAYYMAILIVLLVRPPTPTLESFAVHLTFLHGFVPEYPRGLDPVFWSLTPEVVFYAALPLLVLKLRGFKSRLAILAGLVAVSLATRLLMSGGALESLPVLGESLSGNRPYFFPTTHLYLFMVGVLLRMLVVRIQESGYDPGIRGRTLGAVLTVAPASLLLAFPYLIIERGQVLLSPRTMLADGLVALIFASVLLGSPVMKPVLRWRPLVFFGEISYSVFLLHTTVIFLVTSNFLSGSRGWFAEQGDPVVWGAFAGYVASVLALSTLVSYLSYRFIESPFLRHKPK